MAVDVETRELPRFRKRALAACKDTSNPKGFNSALVKELPLRAATSAADPADVVRAERNVGADRGPTHAHGAAVLTTS